MYLSFKRKKKYSSLQIHKLCKFVHDWQSELEEKNDIMYSTNLWSILLNLSKWDKTLGCYLNHQLSLDDEIVPTITKQNIPLHIHTLFFSFRIQRNVDSFSWVCLWFLWSRSGIYQLPNGLIKFSVNNSLGPAATKVIFLLPPEPEHCLEICPKSLC